MGIGVILVGRGIRIPHFFRVGGRTPPLYKYTKSEILLGPLLFRPKLRHWVWALK